MKTLTTKRAVGTGFGVRWQIAFAFFAFILIGANDGAVGVILPSLSSFYKVDKATVSYLFLAGTTGYLTAAFTSGPLVEKMGRRLFLMLGAGIFVVGALTVAFKPPFLVLLVALLLIGFGVAITDAGLNAYIAGLPHSTATLNYLHAFYGLGALIGPVIASAVLALSLGWNTIYFMWIGVGLVLLVGIGFIYEKRPEPDKAESSATGNVLATALKIRAVWLAAFFLLFYVGAEVSLGNWSYSFLTEERHQPTLLSGWTVSGYWLGLMLGRLTLARIAERIGSKRLVQGCLAGVMVGVLLIWLVPVGIVSAFGLLLTGFSLGPIFPSTIALMPSLVSARLLPSAIGFLASLGAMGAALFPWLAGNLAQGLGLWSLLPFVVVLAVADLGFWLALRNQPQTSPS